MHCSDMQCNTVHAMQWHVMQYTQYSTCSDAKQKKSIFLNKKLVFLKTIVKKKTFFTFFYYLQFKGRKVFFNTLECLFMLHTSCKTYLTCIMSFYMGQDLYTFGYNLYTCGNVFYTWRCNLYICRHSLYTHGYNW